MDARGPHLPGRANSSREYTVPLVLVLLACVTAVRYLAPDQPDQRTLAQKLVQSAVGLLQCFGIFVGVALLLASVEFAKQAVARRRRGGGGPAPPAGSPAPRRTVSTGAGDDTVALGDAGHTLDGIANVTLDAGPGNDVLVADDSGHLAPRTYQVNPDSLTLADRLAPVVSFSGIEAFRLYTGQSATVVDNHGSGYSFDQLQGPPAPAGATTTSAPAAGSNEARLPALIQAGEPQAAAQVSATDLYWLALARDPLARPGLV